TVHVVLGRHVVEDTGAKVGPAAQDRRREPAVARRLEGALEPVLVGVELGQAIVIELPRPDAPGRQMAETDYRQRRLGRHRIQVVALGDPPGKVTGYPDV